MPQTNENPCKVKCNKEMTRKKRLNQKTKQPNGIQLNQNQTKETCTHTQRSTTMEKQRRSINHLRSWK